MTPEPLVSAKEAAAILGINPRLLQAMARKGVAGAYPFGTGDFRKVWRFRVSEVIAAMDPERYDPIRQSPLK